MTDRKLFDVIIIGGSYAGLSAGMALGRSLREVLIIDSGAPCNRQTPHSHNFITQDGEKPAEIAARAKAQVMRYPTVQFREDLAIRGIKLGEHFLIDTAKGEQFKSRKLLFATGIKDVLPDIKGLAECWGISAVHCPYCHGYELRGQKTAIIANGEKAFHLAGLVNNLTTELTIMTLGEADFSEAQMARLEAHSIKVVEMAIAEMVHQNGLISHLRLSDGRELPFSAVYVAAPFEQHSDIPASLGCALTEQGHLQVNMFQQTTVDGAFACGDNSGMMRSVAHAVHSGNIAGAVINKVLVDERF